MFGYISVNQPELKIKEWERYRAYYCGVCRDLRAAHGLSGQATLSYDLTFVGLLLTALYEPEETIAYTRCFAHPTAKHKTLRNEYTAYAAAMNVLLAYHKALDDLRDEKRLRGAAVSGILEHNYRKIVNEYPRQARVAAKSLAEIHRLEAIRSEEIDAVSGAFGSLMAELFVYRKDAWEGQLRRLGFFLGKYIYLLDAYDDIEQDIKKNNYNPLINKRNLDLSGFDAYCERVLTMMISEATRAFEALPVLRDAELIRNILYTGVWGRFYERQKGQSKDAAAKSARRRKTMLK